MIGIIFIVFGTFLSEVSALIGKFEVAHKKETLYLMGFLEMFWATVFFVGLSLFNGNFYLDPASLPTFAARAILEIAVFTFGLLAIIKADRSTNGFLTILTIPLLLGIDIVLGYDIALQQIVGMFIIIAAIVGLYAKRGIQTKGIAYVLLWTFGAAITISLFKYNVTHYNSVEAEQGYMFLILLTYFLVMVIWKSRRNPFPYLWTYPYSFQSLTRGIAVPILSFAYIFAPASIIVTGKRAFSMLWSVLSGNHYYHEKKLGIKVLYLALILVGLVLMY
ncbi:MAG: hypothetical protein AAB365_00450 [Patescibacteria group bacterium]